MPILLVCDACGSDFTVKDELSGKKLRCSKCQNVIQVPNAGMDSQTKPAYAGSSTAFHRDRFLINQKKLSISEKYMILDESDRPLLYVVRPAHFFRRLLAIFVCTIFIIVCIVISVIIASAFGNSEAGNAIGVIFGFLSMIGAIAILILMSPKRHVSFYADEAKTKPVLHVSQDQKFSLIHAWYTVSCPEHGELGRFMKNYLYNFYRKRWYIYDSDGTNRLLAQEDSMILSLLRRFLGHFFGILRTNYIIVDPVSKHVIGEFNRKFSLFDKYVLDMSADRSLELDRRMAVALAVMLDTGERR
jgi:predicted Zn finger-like uncharacterized protein